MADREVVDLQAGVGDGDRGDEDAYGYPYVGAERSVGVACGPVHLHVNHRIVGDIERVGYGSEEFACRDGAFSLQRAAGSRQDDVLTFHYLEQCRALLHRCREEGLVPVDTFYCNGLFTFLDQDGVSNKIGDIYLPVTESPAET